jgi:hypothetical protein
LAHLAQIFLRFFYSLVSQLTMTHSHLGCGVIAFKSDSDFKERMRWHKTSTQRKRDVCTHHFCLFFLRGSSSRFSAASFLTGWKSMRGFGEGVKVLPWKNV